MGRLIFRLGQFESILAVAVRNWMPEEQRPTVQEMAKRQIAQKIGLARKLSSTISDEGLRSQFLKVLDTAEAAYEIRNDVMHGSWQIDPEEKRQVVVNFSKPHGEERYVVDVQDAARRADKALRGLLEVLLKKSGVDIEVDMIPFYSKDPPWAATKA
jgi:hypothetical protein